MGRVVIGMDPHKHSATIEVMDDQETVLGGGRFGTDTAGYRAMLGCARRWPERIWAVEGCQGIGGHIASRLVADGEQVVDVPPKLSARTRMFASGQGRKTDATDAHSVALVATRMSGLRPVIDNQQLAVLRIVADRRRSLGEDHSRMISQLHQLLLELIPGGAKKALSAVRRRPLISRSGLHCAQINLIGFPQTVISEEPSGPAGELRSLCACGSFAALRCAALPGQGCSA